MISKDAAAIILDILIFCPFPSCNYATVAPTNRNGTSQRSCDPNKTTFGYWKWFSPPSSSSTWLHQKASTARAWVRETLNYAHNCTNWRDDGDTIAEPFSKLSFPHVGTKSHEWSCVLAVAQAHFSMRRNAGNSNTRPADQTWPPEIPAFISIY